MSDDLLDFSAYAKPTKNASPYDAFIEESASKYDLDPDFIRATMRQESSFKPRATSHKGASGLMQLMPATARRLGVKNIYDPKENIDGGAKYLRQHLDEFGSVPLALAAYNAGEGAVRKYGKKIPPYKETQDYVQNVTSRYKGTGRRQQLDFSQYAETAAPSISSQTEIGADEVMGYINSAFPKRFQVTSGDRTPERNKQVGGVPDSYHLQKNRAKDFIPVNGRFAEGEKERLGELVAQYGYEVIQHKHNNSYHIEPSKKKAQPVLDFSQYAQPEQIDFIPYAQNGNPF